MNSPFRGGMQVHAVPPDERAFDSRGQQLPWGYAYADANLNRKQTQPLEKGPFGRATNHRSRTRSKTATPALTREDIARQENNKFADDIFNQFKTELEAGQAQIPPSGTATGQSKAGASALGPGNVASASRGARRPSAGEGMEPQPAAMQGVGGAAAGTAAAAVASQPTLVEPTELLIYGFPPEFQPDAIAYYERVTDSFIYEDYDRSPPEARFATPLSSFNASHQPHVPPSFKPPPQQQQSGQQANTQQHRAPSLRSLNGTALRKINTYAGGAHWIKVTLPTPEAAEAATHYSPSVQHGYLVYAELYRGAPPSVGDVAIPANGNLSGADSLSGRRAGSDSRSGSRPFSTAPARARSSHQPAVPGPLAEEPLDASPSQDSTVASLASSATASSGTATGNDARAVSPAAAHLQHRASLRIPTATRAVLRPASEALLPVPPWTQRAFGHVPVVGALLFGGDAGAGAKHAAPGAQLASAPAGAAPGAPGTAGTGAAGAAGVGVWGAAVPRRDDSGAFDWDRASFWWRLCWWLDSWVGSDLCGIKGDD